MHVRQVRQIIAYIDFQDPNSSRIEIAFISHVPGPCRVIFPLIYLSARFFACVYVC